MSIVHFHSIMPIIRFVIGFPLLALGTLGAMLCVGAIKVMGASAGNYSRASPQKRNPNTSSKRARSSQAM